MHRRRRGSRSSEIRKALFTVFNVKGFSHINLNSTPHEIKIWKELKITKECYNLLHEPISKNNDNDNTLTWCGKIINNLWKNQFKVTNEQYAFVIVVCEYLLNPNIENIRNDADYIKKKLVQVRVSIKYRNTEKNQIYSK